MFTASVTPYPHTPSYDSNKYYIRVNKSQARKAYESGIIVYLLPHKIRLNNAWITPYPIDTATGFDFDRMVDHYSYYNCMHETGYYPAYYIADTD